MRLATVATSLLVRCSSRPWLATCIGWPEGNNVDCRRRDAKYCVSTTRHNLRMFANIDDSLQRLQRLRFGGINHAVGACNFLDIFKKCFAEFRICAAELLEGVFKESVQFALVKIVIVADSPVKLLLQVRSFRK